MIFDFYMHDRAEFRAFKADFVLRKADSWKNTGEKQKKKANSASKRASCAYNFVYFTFLYAFSCEKQNFPSKSWKRKVGLRPLLSKKLLSENLKSML